MKKIKILLASLCLYGNVALAQIPTTATQVDFGPTGTYFTNNALAFPCLQTGSVNSMTFPAICPSGSGITNVVKTTTFSAVGGAQINSQTTTGNVTFQMISVPVAGSSGLARYPTGSIYVDYTCSYDSTYNVSYCGTDPVNTTVHLKRSGRAHIDFFQKFTWARPIVGPDCVKNGEEVTFSIFDYLSSQIDNKDVYTWTYPAAWSVLYYSYDKSSITLKATTVSAGDQLTVRVGNCNTAINTKYISSPGVVAAPTIVKNYCLGTGATTWPVAFITNTPDPSITYSWDITASGAGFTYASGSASTTQGPITVNIGSATSGYILFKSSRVVGSSCPNAEHVDTIKFGRALTGSVTGPACVAIGTSSATYTISNLPTNTSIVWTLPAGMTPTTGTTTTATTSISVNVTSALSYGYINATAASGACAGSIAGLGNINPIPVLTAIAGPVCVARNANVSYTATGSGYDNLSWTAFGVGPTTGSSTYSVTVPSNFTGGTISAVANKGTCTSASKSLAVKWNAAGINLTSLTADKSCLNMGVPQTITFTTDAGYDTYTWNLPTGWAGTSTTNSITYTTNGTTGTVSVTAKNGTCGSTNSKSLAVTPAPAVTVTNSGVVNGVVTLSVPAGSTSYSWYKNLSDLGVHTNYLLLPVTGTINNSYCVDVTSSGGCVTRACSASTSTPAARMANTEELESTTATTITVSPNPASKIVEVKAGSALIGQSYVVTNMTGQQVAQGTLSSDGSIDVSGWSTGMYILRSGNTSVKIQVAK